jgi:hypothetical protein
VENNCAAQTGIGEADAVDVALFPNPAASFLVVTGSGLKGAEYRITDVTGKTMKQGNLDNGYIDLLELAGGAYLLTLRTATYQAVRRFVRME